MGDPGKADIDLVRVSLSPEGAFGVLAVGGVPLGPVTLERTYPVAESEPRGPQYVKIPAGRYRCARTRYHRGGYDTYEVSGVVGHSRLLFHAGNLEDDSEGCVLVGQRFGFINGRPGVLQSRLGFAEFMQALGKRPEFSLAVKYAAVEV